MKKIFFTAVSLFYILVTMPTVFAAETGLAQLAGCSGVDCSACNVVHLANGGIKWPIGILFVVFALLLAIAGVKLVTAGGNHHALDEAKSSFTNAIVGFMIILSAWLVVDTIMRALVGTNGREGQIGSIGSDGQVTGWLFWSNVQCQKYIKPKYNEFDQEEVKYIELEVYDDGTSISESGVPAPSVNPPISTAPAVITGTLVTYAGARFDSGIVGKVQYVATAFSLRVSGGYRTPERNRAVGGVANSNHLTGRAADFVGTQAQMEAARQWARNNGAREALIHNAGSGTHLHLAW